MKNLASTEVKNKGNESMGNKMVMFLHKHAVPITLAMLVVIMMGGTVFAADALWATLSSTIQTWVTRLGGVIMFVGGIMFGLGWKSDDAEQKSRGVSTMIAGGIVIAVAALTGTFFA